jgi:hypothetical protein
MKIPDRAYDIKNHISKKILKIFLLNFVCLLSIISDINRKKNNWLLSLFWELFPLFHVYMTHNFFEEGDGTIVKLRLYDGENVMVRWWYCDGTMVKTRWYYWWKRDGTMVCPWWHNEENMMSHRVFTSILSPFLPSYHHASRVKTKLKVTIVQTEHLKYQNKE